MTSRILLLVVVVLAGALVWQSWRPTQDVVESPAGEAPSTSYTSDNGVALIVTSPLSGAIVTSPLLVTGEAPGTWYFEATFPLVMVNWDGLIIGEGYAQAQGEWMTPEMVPFVGTVEFGEVLPLTKGEPDGVAWGGDFFKNGALILQRDNPSGLSQNDDALEIPLILSPQE